MEGPLRRDLGSLIIPLLKFLRLVHKGLKAG
jgi:hypothetical protein